MPLETCEPAPPTPLPVLVCGAFPDPYPPTSSPPSPIEGRCFDELPQPEAIAAVDIIERIKK
jgi:hypothetical protein